jgi:NRPS condensation-like uncharacterized protein
VPDRQDTNTLQERVEGAGDVAAQRAAAPIADPVALLRHLDESGWFHRDSRVGRMYHPGMVSLRENVARDSLHVSIDDNRLMAHVDEVSPLVADADSESHYSARRAFAHNAAGIAHDARSLLRGRQGDHRCRLDCTWSPEAGRHPARLLEPGMRGVHVELRVAGTFDETRLRTALGAALGDAPPRREWLTVVDCPDPDALHAERTRLHDTVIATDAFAPLQASLARSPAGDVLMLNISHAAVDPFDAMRVLDRIATTYANPDARARALEFLASSDLPIRPVLPTSSSTIARMRTRLISALRHRLSPHTPIAPDDPGTVAGCAFHLVTLSRHDSDELTQAARGDGRTYLLMAALHRAIDDWNERHEVSSRHISVLVPTNLRDKRGGNDALANFSISTRLSTSPRQRATPSSTAKTVKLRASLNKQTRTGIALIAALERAGLLALWAKQSTVVLQPLTNNATVDAAMLCDLGASPQPPAFGPDAGDTLGVWCSVPARSPQSISIGALTVAGCLHLSFRYPHRLLSPDAARAFADCYREQLRRVVHEGA